MKKPLAHAPISELNIIQDRLFIGDVSVAELALRAGQTPFYAYDRSAMTRRVAALREQLPKGVSLHYAMKANPMPAVVQHMAGLVDGLDVASGGELSIALDTGTSAAEISFAGPGKRDVELIQAISSGITVNIESLGELERLVQHAEKLGVTPNVAVRVNPDFELKSSGMKMAGGAKQFGVDAESVPEVLARIGDMGVHFRGFHIFSGSQNLRPESLVEVHCATFELAKKLFQQAPSQVELLNIGGGFGIPYFPGEAPLDLSSVADNLNEQLHAHRQMLQHTEIVLELGRYLVGEAGVYVARVIDRKVSRGQVFLVTDGGLHHHLAASGNFGQILRKNYPVVNANRVHGQPREIVNVVGPLCTPLDILADKMELGSAMPGDLIAVLQSGAYGYSASPSGFLSHPPAVEILV